VAGIRVESGSPDGSAGAPATAWVQSERGRAVDGEIGEALILPPGIPATFEQGHILGVLARDLRGPVVWHAGATWSKGLNYITPDAWRARVAETAARLAAPLVVRPGRR